MGIRVLLKVFVPLVAVGVVLVYGADSLYRLALQSEALRVKGVEVEQPGGFEVAEVLKLAQVPLGTNMLELNLDKIRQRLELHPRIYHASVAKSLSGVVRIALEPEVPAAIISTNGLTYVNREGVPYSKVKPGESLDFPLISVKGASKPEQVAPSSIARALQLYRWAEQAKVLDVADIGDLQILPEDKLGEVPLRMTMLFPPAALRKNNNTRHIQVTFGESELPKQLERLEAALKLLVEKQKTPRKIRMELGKKVVVKIAQ